VACSHGSTPRAQTSSAPPTTAANTTTTAAPVSYQVQRGDTLSSIAKRFSVAVDAIITANHLTDRDRLTEGQVLVIPPAVPVTLDVAPPAGTPGSTFQLKLTGAKPSEAITFEVDSPSGGTFTGPPHTASTDGSVTAKYQTTPQDVPGTYAVAARGTEGTAAQSSFQVNPPSSSSR